MWFTKTGHRALKNWSSIQGSRHTWQKWDKEITHRGNKLLQKSKSSMALTSAALKNQTSASGGPPHRGSRMQLDREPRVAKFILPSGQSPTHFRHDMTHKAVSQLLPSAQSPLGTEGRQLSVEPSKVLFCWNLVRVSKGNPPHWTKLSCSIPNYCCTYIYLVVHF